MIKGSYNISKGDRVLVYTVELDGEPATVSCVNNYGNVVVIYDKVQESIDEDGVVSKYSGQLVHPKQVEKIKE